MATCLLDVEFSGRWYCHGCLDGCYKFFWAETVSQCRGHVSFLPSGSSWLCSGVVLACIAAVWRKQKCTGNFLNMTKSECERVCSIADVETVLSTECNREWMGKKYISYRKCSHCVTTKHSYKIFSTNKNFWPFVPETCNSYFKWIQVINVAAGFCYLPSLNSVIPHWISWVLTYIQLFISFQKSKILFKNSFSGWGERSD